VSDRAIFRVRDIKQSITNIRELLGGRGFDELYADNVSRAAFERFLEILSEASRSVPDEWKTEFGADLPWRQIADLGNVLRHAYHRTDFKLLWLIYQDHLGPLEVSIDAMLETYDLAPD
jgi:uncharacterized protein with HEPN domain